MRTCGLDPPGSFFAHEVKRRVGEWERERGSESVLRQQAVHVEYAFGVLSAHAARGVRMLRVECAIAR